MNEFEKQRTPGWIVALALSAMAACFALLFAKMFVLACLACMASGFVCGLTMNDAWSRQPLFVKVFLVAMIAGCGIAGWVSFASHSILVIFPGFPTAFASGQLLGSLAAIWRK